jgi:hypothetical protein
MSTRFCIGYSNRIDDATLTGGSWGGYPLTYLQNRSLTFVARSSNADESATIVDIDMGSATTDQVLWVHGHNLSSAAEFVVERGTTQGGTDVYAGEQLPVWSFTPINGIYSGRYFGFGLVMPTANSAQWTRLRILNATNPSGYVQISRIFLGPLFSPEYGPTELSDEWINHSNVERITGGADWVSKRPPRRSRRFVFGALTYEEGRTIKKIQRLHDTASEVVYIADRFDREQMQRNSFLGLFSELGALDYPFWQHNGIAISIDERGGAPAV